MEKSSNSSNNKNIIRISSKDNKLIKFLYKLRTNYKEIKKNNIFIVEGEHLVKMANSSKVLEYVLTLEELNYLSSNIIQYLVNEEIMKKLSINKSISKVIGVVRIKDNNIDNIINNLTNNSGSNTNNKNITIYLDNLQDPGNVGTIIRTSLAFNLNTVISTNFPIFYNEKTIQASQGAIFNMNLIKGDITLLNSLKDKGYKIVATTLNTHSIDLEEFKTIYKNELDNIVLVMGNEGQGISKEIEEIADYFVKINISNTIDSLNVAIAHSIVLYTLKIM